MKYRERKNNEGKERMRIARLERLWSKKNGSSGIQTYISLRELSELLGVTYETIRRDASIGVLFPTIQIKNHLTRGKLARCVDWRVAVRYASERLSGRKQRPRSSHGSPRTNRIAQLRNEGKKYKEIAKIMKIKEMSAITAYSRFKKRKINSEFFYVQSEI